MSKAELFIDQSVLNEFKALMIDHTIDYGQLSLQAEAIHKWISMGENVVFLSSYNRLMEVISNWVSDMSRIENGETAIITFNTTKLVEHLAKPVPTEDECKQWVEDVLAGRLEIDGK